MSNAKDLLPAFSAYDIEYTKKAVTPTAFFVC